jgi:hypothetical protein
MSSPLYLASSVTDRLLFYLTGCGRTIFFEVIRLPPEAEIFRPDDDDVIMGYFKEASHRYDMENPFERSGVFRSEWRELSLAATRNQDTIDWTMEKEPIHMHGNVLLYWIGLDWIVAVCC